MQTIRIGDRVTALQYGEQKTGTVTRIGRGIVFVLFDGTTRERWLHVSSVTRA